jgi:hypothetical protein
VDADLLVPLGRLGQAEEALSANGLRPLLGKAALSEHEPHARMFVAEDGAEAIDLHWTVRGAGAAPEVVWKALDRESAPLEVAGLPIPVPGEAARALLVALHAAQHGPQGLVQLDDVARAAERIPLDVWRRAAALAEELEAVQAFAAGLRLAPRGRDLLATLAIRAGPTMDLAIRAQGNVPVARGLLRLSQTSGAGQKLRLLAREIWPTPSFMRSWMPIARRGRWGLAVARAYRPLWLGIHLGPALLALRRASSTKR